MKDKEWCSGCNACKQVCPVGAINEFVNKKGFYTVKRNEERCIKCGLCDKICPFKNNAKENYPICSYGFCFNDVEQRFLSQSGGAFKAFALHTVNNGGIIYGVSFDGNEAFYKRINNESEILDLLGSKYIQARMGDVFNDVEKDLLNGKKVLFVGIPCHIHGLKQYLQHQKADTSSLVLIDLICHGTPSPISFKLYKKELINKYGDIGIFNFRDKSIGWHGHICSFKVNSRKLYSRDFVKLFYSNLYLNDCCYSCQYASQNRQGDISIGDLWGSEEAYPELNDNLGTSLIIVNTLKGKDFIKHVTQYGKLVPVSLDKCYQKNIYEPTDKPEQFDEFWECIENVGFMQASRAYLDFRPVEMTNYELFWKSYDIDLLIRDLHEKNIYLYGVGATMIQLLELLRFYKCQVKGIFDNTYNSGYFNDIEIISIDKITKSNSDMIIICSRNSNSITTIIERLKNDRKYDGVDILSLDNYLLQ